jgi:hypothetical protein
MTHLRLCFIFVLVSCSIAPTKRTRIKVVHYNIKELTTNKIVNQSEQVRTALNLIKPIKADLLSLNEVQYDLANVPILGMPGDGLNLARLNKSISIGSHHFLGRANTGGAAKKKSNGYYHGQVNAKTRKMADPVNFGVFPHQYSTGLISKYEIVNAIEYRNLRWKDHFPDRDLSQFRDANGQKLKDDILLFDKSFIHLTVMINSMPIEVVLLHTVPAFHFGNKRTMNYARNEDQLHFLKWFLTGKINTSFNPDGIKPLGVKSRFVAMGDWNVDLKNKSASGAKVLSSLFKEVSLWMASPTYTHEGSGFRPNNLRMTLDYIVTSRNIKVLDGGILKPGFKRVELGCYKDKIGKLPVGYILKDYRDYKKNRTCFVAINPKELDYKNASDHFPIWAELEL